MNTKRYLSGLTMEQLSHIKHTLKRASVIVPGHPRRKKDTVKAIVKSILSVDIGFAADNLPPAPPPVSAPVFNEERIQQYLAASKELHQKAQFLLTSSVE